MQQDTQKPAVDKVTIRNSSMAQQVFHDVAIELSVRAFSDWEGEEEYLLHLKRRTENPQGVVSDIQSGIKHIETAIRSGHTADNYIINMYKSVAITALLEATIIDMENTGHTERIYAMDAFEERLGEPGERFFEVECDEESYAESVERATVDPLGAVSDIRVELDRIESAACDKASPDAWELLIRPFERIGQIAFVAYSIGLLRVMYNSCREQIEQNYRIIDNIRVYDHEVDELISALPNCDSLYGVIVKKEDAKRIGKRAIADVLDSIRKTLKVIAQLEDAGIYG